MSLEPDEISLKPDKSLTRADVENMLKQYGDSTKLNLSGLNLSVVNFAEMDLSGAAFAYAHLNGANLLDANLEKSTLNSARLNGVKGHRVKLDEADLANASMIEAKLDEASFNKAFLSHTNLSGADLRRANLSEANLDGANLSEANLDGANLSGASLSQANLSRAVLHDTDLSDTDLRGAILGGAKLDGARLDGANLSQVRLLLANLRQAKLSHAILNRTDFSWSDLGEADLTGADLTGAKLVETDLTGADLRDANLSQANLSGANLNDARLVGANLHEVNLSGATLAGAFLSDEQKELLVGAGDVLGLEQTRSADDLSAFETSFFLPQPLEEVAHTANGAVSQEEVSDLHLSEQTEADLEAAAELPSLTSDLESLEDIIPAEESTPPATSAETELPPLSPDLTGESRPDFSPVFVEPNDSTLSIVVQETPVSVADLGRLLSSLDHLHTSLMLLRQEKFAELIEFYHSPGSFSGPVGGLLVRNFDVATGRIELVADDPAALLALSAVLAGIGSHSTEISAPELAENTLDNFLPGLDPVVRAMSTLVLAENIRQLAAGPKIALAAPASTERPQSKSGNPLSGETATDTPTGLKHKDRENPGSGPAVKGVKNRGSKRI